MSKKIYRVLRSNMFIVFIFFVLSLLSTAILYKSQFVGWGDDVHFQWSRMYELRNSIKYGNLFPSIALNKFFESGVAVMDMYPKFNLYPIVMLSFFIKSFVHLVYITFMLKTFLSLLIAYISSSMFNRNRKVSFIFSLSYSLSTVMLFYSFHSMDIGVSSSLIFLPLVLFGTYSLMDDYKHWKELALGISCIMLCHVLTAIFAISLVLVIILINYGYLKNKKFILSLVKAGLFTLLITSAFWMPFLVILTNNNIHSVNLFPLNGTDFISFVSIIFNNSVGTTSGADYIYINIFAFIGLMMGIINYKNMTKYLKQIFWISIVILIIASSFFPWNILNNTFIKVIQFSWRLYIIPQLLLTYVFADNVINLCKNKKKTFVILPLIIISILCVQVTGQKELVNQYMNHRFDSSYVIKDDNIFDNDYRPSQVDPVLNIIGSHEGTYGKNNHVMVNRLENGKFSFKLNNNASSFNMPFVMFNGINYQVKVDGNNYKFHADQYSRLTINHLSKGKHTVQVIVHKSWYDYLSYVLSALGVIILTFTWIKSLILKRKNK